MGVANPGSGTTTPDVTDRAARLIGAEQHGIADTSGGGTTAAAPASGAAVASIGAPPAGVYAIEVTTFQGGTVDANVSNMRFQAGGLNVQIPSTATPVVSRFERVTMNGVANIAVVVGAAAGGASSIYVAHIRATRLS